MLRKIIIVRMFYETEVSSKPRQLIDARQRWYNTRADDNYTDQLYIVLPSDLSDRDNSIGT